MNIRKCDWDDYDLFTALVYECKLERFCQFLGILYHHDNFSIKRKVVLNF